MRQPVTHELASEFEDRNLFLWSTLGLISLLREVRRALPRDTARRPILTLVDAPPAVAGNEILYAVLGLVSFSETAMRRWREVPASGRPHAVRDSSPSTGRAARPPRALLV